MSEIALDARYVASARSKDEQFLSMFKNHLIKVLNQHSTVYDWWFLTGKRKKGPAGKDDDR